MTFSTLVTGVGYLGKRYCELAGDEAHGLTRAQYDLDDGGELPLELPTDYRVLYTVPPARGARTDVRLERLLEVLHPAPRRFVYISTTGVYGDCLGAVVTEESPVKPDNRLSRPRVDAENRLAEWADDTGCQLVVLRVPGIYGPGRLGLDRIEAGEAYLNEAEANPGNRIHVDDLVACCLAAMQESTPPGIYNVGDGDHRSGTWFADEVARQAGLPEPPKISRGEAAQIFSPMRLAFLASSRIVDTTRMRDVLGIAPRTPEDGIRDSLLQEGL